MSLLLHKADISSACWNIILLILVWQIFLSSLSICSNIALLLLYILNYEKLDENKKKLILLIILGGLLLIGYSFIQENEITLIIRLALVLLFVLGAYFVKLNYKVCLRSLFLYSLSLCIFLIISEILFFSLYGEGNTSEIRLLFRENDWGDAYFMNGYYKIQIKGNAIIPFIYMLSYIVEIFPTKQKKIFRIIYLLAIGIAGNFAFFLSVIGFHSILYFNTKKSQKELFKRLGIGLMILFIVGIPFLSYISETLEQKKEVSNAIRVEQAILLLEDMQENPVTVLLGKGLGNTIDVITSFRNYIGTTYYELQVLYVFNQLGIILFTIFVLLNIIFICKYMPDSKIRMVYGGYIFYAVTNPYILDTNHVVVIISLLAAQYQLSHNLSSIWKK